MVKQKKKKKQFFFVAQMTKMICLSIIWPRKQIRPLILQGEGIKRRKHCCDSETLILFGMKLPRLLRDINHCNVIRQDLMRSNFEPKTGHM